jgi:hypothetical protein
MYKIECNLYRLGSFGRRCCVSVYDCASQSQTLYSKPRGPALFSRLVCKFWSPNYRESPLLVPQLQNRTNKSLEFLPFSFLFISAQSLKNHSKNFVLKHTILYIHCVALLM